MTAVEADDPEHVLRGLRSARRQHRLENFDAFEALYQAYLVAIAVAAAAYIGSGALGDNPFTPEQLTDLASRGSQWFGLVVALVLGVALRSGARGGPLALEAPEVRHVMLAPIDRALALRGPAARALRFAAFVGASTGALLALIFFRRLSASVGEWLLSGAIVFALVAVMFVAVAMITSGLRLNIWIANAIAVLLVGWSTVDLVADIHTSIGTQAGELLFAPIEFEPVSVVFIVAAAIVVVVGLVVVGGTSLEAAERRSKLVSQLRFAATMRDLRTVMLLRQQLAGESMRSRPWLGLKLRSRWPVFTRQMANYLRWPPARFARVLGEAVLAGVALVGVWRGTTPLIVVAGLLLWMVGLEVAEPLGEEIDHPSLVRSYPKPSGTIYLLLAPLVMVVTAVVTVIAAAIVIGFDQLDVAPGLVLLALLPAALLAACGAMVNVTLSATSGPTPALSSSAPPEALGLIAIVRLAGPPALAIGGLIPFVALRDAAIDGVSTGQVVSNMVVPFVLACGVCLGWLRFRDEARAWISSMTEQASTPKSDTENEEK